MGIPKKATYRVVHNALERGKKRTEYSGAIRKYLDKLYLSHDKEADNIIVYSNMVFIFNGQLLITVMHVPSKYLKNYKPK